MCLFLVFFDFCSIEVTVAEDSDDEFAYEEVRLIVTRGTPGGCAEKVLEP